MPPYPDIQQGQVIQDPGIGGAFANAFSGVAQAMKERQKLDMDKQELEAKLQYYKVNTEGSKLDNLKKQDELKATQRGLKAKEGGLRAYTEWVGGGARQEDLGKITAGISDPEASQDFINRVYEHSKTQNEAAVAQGNAADAAVKSATTTQQIAEQTSKTSTAASQAITQGAIAAEAPAQEAAQTRLLKAQAREADARAIAVAQTKVENLDAKAMTLFKLGNLTAKDAWGRYGIKPPEGMDPNAKFVQQRSNMAQYRARAKVAATQILASNDELNTLIDGGVQITGKTNAALKLPLDMGRVLIPDDQKQMLAAANTVVSLFGLMISGQAMAEPEARRIALQIMPQLGDGEKIMRSKQIRREMFAQVTLDASRDSSRPISEIMGDVIRLSKERGVDPKFYQFLVESQRKAKLSEAKAAADPSNFTPEPVTDDPTQTSADSVDALLRTR